MERFPFGRPLNRDPDAKPAPEQEAIPGRPGWFRTPAGERYVEPPAKPKSIIPPYERKPV